MSFRQIIENLSARPKQRPVGFTIMELTVTISLIVLMVTLSGVSYRRANKRTELILATQQAASNFRLAQTYAASAKEVKNNPAFNIWGIYLDKNNAQKVTMFVDENKNGWYEESEKYKEILLPTQVKLSKFFYKQGVVDRQEISNNQISVTFVPPDPKVRMCLSTTGCGSYNWTTQTGVWSESWDDFYVVLVDEINQSTKDINVNFFGLIDAR